jgi:8-oxo-dGTP diphosphatase
LVELWNMEKIIVYQKAIIFNEEGKILTLYRSETAPSRPNTWDFPGGHLDFGEDTTKGILREIKEETGLDIKELAIFDVTSKINEKGEFCVTIAYKAKTDSDKVTLSFEHTQFKWVTPEEFLNLESSETQRYFVKNL